MASSGLYRWAGYAGVIGAVVLVLGDWLHPQTLAANPGGWVLAHELLFVSLILGVAGIFGVYTRQAKETGSLGFIGFLLAFIALMSYTGIVWFEAFISPALLQDAAAAAAIEKVESGATPSLVLPLLMASSIAFSLGWVLLGWATARAGVLPRTAAYLALVGGVFFGLSPLLFASMPLLEKLSATVFGVGFLWLAWGLTAERKMMMARA